MPRSLRHRFPGVLHPRSGSPWSRFDAPAGTQMVDTAITAVTDWMLSGDNAAGGGHFAAAAACDELLDRARATVGQLLGADPAGLSFGPNMTSLTFHLADAIARTLRPGDRVVGTRLDHDANVSPWRRACDLSGAEQVLAPFDPATGRLDPTAVIDLIDERTRWVTLPGASNLLGTTPDLAPIIDAAHDAGALVFVDAVALTPHRRIDIATLGCDALATSPYKWYGPHAGVMWVRPELSDTLPSAKVRPAAATGPRRRETGMPNFEGIAGVEAAARFLLEEGIDSIAAAEAEVFEPLLDGLASMSGVRIWGPADMVDRTPTVAFTVDGRSPAEVAQALARDAIAVWDGHNYAVEVVAHLGLAETGGVVRAGLARYIEPDDVQRLLTSVERLT